MRSTYSRQRDLNARGAFSRDTSVVVEAEQQARMETRRLTDDQDDDAAEDGAVAAAATEEDRDSSRASTTIQIHSRWAAHAQQLPQLP